MIHDIKKGSPYFEGFGKSCTYMIENLDKDLGKYAGEMIEKAGEITDSLAGTEAELFFRDVLVSYLSERERAWIKKEKEPDKSRFKQMLKEFWFLIKQVNESDLKKTRKERNGFEDKWREFSFSADLVHALVCYFPEKKEREDVA